MKTILNILFLVSGLIAFNNFTFCPDVSCTSTNPFVLSSTDNGVKVCITVY